MSDDTTDGESVTDTTTQRDSLVYEIDEDERPSVAVVRAVGALTNTATLDLEPMYHAIDPEYLDKLASVRDGSENRSISFEYSECSVTVTPRTVQVQLAAE